MVLPVLDAATPRNCIYPARWSTLRNRIHSMHRSAEREMTRSGKDAFSVSDISKVLEPKVIRDHDVLAHQKLLFVSLACYLVHTISLPLHTGSGTETSRKIVITIPPRNYLSCGVNEFH